MDERIRTAKERPQALSPRVVRRVAPPADSVRLWLRRQNGWTPPNPPPPLNVEAWRPVPRLTRPWFQNEYEQTKWVFSGAAKLTPLDTMLTTKLRARLEDRFGPPTHTTGDYSPHEFEQAASPAQFEYWLVVNDSIPMKVMDVNGPFERGLVVSSARRYRRQLADLRDALEEELLEEAQPAVFVDYYHLAVSDAWFRTGYDGERYFLESIDAPNLHLGRAWLDENNTARERP